MKILLATGMFPPEIGGPATYSKLLADLMPARGVAVRVENFGDVRRLPKGIRHLVYMVRLIWHGRGADVIFSQDAVSVGIPALIAAYILGKVFVIRLPGDYAWEQALQRFGVTDTMEEFQTKTYPQKIERLRRLERWVLESADAVIVPSKRMAEIVKKWLSRPEKVYAIYNGVNIDGILEAARGIPRKPKTLITAGRLVNGKGYETLIIAMKKLPDWTLEIAGDGPIQDKLEMLIADNGLNARAKLLGRLERGDLARRIAQSEVFVLNTAFETFSFQVVEAMAVGTPVITTKRGSLPELVDDGVNGFLIEPDDETVLIDRVQKISNDKTLRDRMSAAAKLKAEQFSISRTLDAVQGVLNPAVAHPMNGKSARHRIAKVGRYLFSGGIAAFTNIGLLWLMVHPLKIHYLVATAVAYIITFCVSFVMQKFFTFQDHSTEGMHGQAIFYLLVTVPNLLINEGLMYLCVDKLGWGPVWSQILISILIAAESYIIYGMFIFKKRHHRH